MRASRTERSRRLRRTELPVYVCLGLGVAKTLLVTAIWQDTPLPLWINALRLSLSSGIVAICAHWAVVRYFAPDPLPPGWARGLHIGEVLVALVSGVILGYGLGLDPSVPVPKLRFW